MGRSVAVSTTLSADKLRKLARRERDGKVSLRLISVAAVLEGAKRHVAARQGGMDRQTLCDWIHRFNADGVGGLRDRPHGHPVRRLTAEQEAQVRDYVLKGPDPEKDRLVRWRCVDVQAYIAVTFKVAYHESTIGKLLRRLGLRHVSVRPAHPKGDAEARAAFKKTS
jgi:transposase